MDKERESAIQREKEERAEEIISLKNEHEKMLQTLNLNFERALEKKQREHEKEIHNLKEEMTREREVI